MIYKYMEKEKKIFKLEEEKSDKSAEWMVEVFDRSPWIHNELAEGRVEPLLESAKDIMKELSVFRGEQIEGVNTEKVHNAISGMVVFLEKKIKESEYDEGDANELDSTLERVKEWLVKREKLEEFMEEHKN